MPCPRNLEDKKAVMPYCDVNSSYSTLIPKPTNSTYIILFLLNEWSCCRTQFYHCLALSLSQSVSALVELIWVAKIFGFVIYVYMDKISCCMDLSIFLRVMCPQVYSFFRSARASCTTSGGPARAKNLDTYIQAYMPHESSGDSSNQPNCSMGSPRRLPWPPGTL